MTIPLGRITSVPTYPVVFVVAWMISLFTESTASVHVLMRPLILGSVIVAVAEIGLSGLLRNRDIGALVVLMFGVSLLGMAQLALILVIVVTVVVAVAATQRRPLADLPWRAATRWLNVISAITLALALLNSVQAGALTPFEDQPTGPRGAATQAMPDVYLILLDAYPRTDTLAEQFGYDNRPFLDQMRSMGFDVSTHSHSNYNVTALSLASMFNMAQVADLPGIAESPSALSEYRALTRAINHGRGFAELRTAGYELVAIPSGFSSVTTFSVDRLLDGGQLTDFEYDILAQGVIPVLLPDVIGPWLVDQHRDRTLVTFERLAEVAAERPGHPRFVFAHVLSPHPPIAFGASGEPRDGWPCFPDNCGIWYGGQVYGDAALAPFRDQVAYINSRVVATTRQILANSERPPIIVLLSDHGSRHDTSDADEALRSFFVASTPGRAGLFPDDVTPVNIIPRILDAYGAGGLPFASEESYWVDPTQADKDGPPLDLIPWPVQDP